MQYNVGETVFMPISNKKGTVRSILKDDEGRICYQVVPENCPFSYDFFEDDLKPFIQATNQEYIKLPDETKKKVLIVEDGSVDIDKLEEDGFYVIVYRQGSKPPIFLEV